jgi:hypothetical protein
VLSLVLVVFPVLVLGLFQLALLWELKVLLMYQKCETSKMLDLILLEQVVVPVVFRVLVQLL